MLSPRENMWETVKGGNPDRFVKQYEALALAPHPAFILRGDPQRGEESKVNSWGVTFSFRQDQMAPYPVHTPETIVCKDLEEWRTYVKKPRGTFTEEEWAPFVEMAQRQLHLSVAGHVCGVLP